MKKIAFFISVLISLNASVIVRKPEEESNSISTVKVSSMEPTQTYSTWLQSIIQNLSVYFYGITKSGDIQAISWSEIQQMIKKKKVNSIEKVSDNWVFYQYHEKGDFDS